MRRRNLGRGDHVLNPWGLTAIVLCLLAAPGDVRTWSDSTGKHKTEAGLLNVTSDIVLLRKTDGEVISLHVAQFVRIGQAFHSEACR